MFRTEIIKIVGNANKRWGQTFVEANLFIVLEIEGVEKAAEIGHQIIEKLEKDYHKLEEKTLQSIKKVVVSLQLEENINLIIGVVKTNILYLIGYGAGQVRLKRGKSWGVVLTGKGSSSGVLEEGDIVIFSSPTFAKLISEKELQETLSYYSWKEVEETLASRTQASSKNQGAAALLVRFLKSEKKTKEAKRYQFSDKFTKLFRVVKRLRTLRALRLKERIKPEGGRRLTASIGAILALLLIGSLIFGSYQKEKTLQQQELERLKEKVLPQISEAKALLDLNIFQSRRLLSETKTSLEETFPKLKKNSKESQDVEKLLKEVHQLLLLTQKDFQISEVPAFFDLAWIKEGGRGSSLAVYRDNLIILDKETKSVYQLNLTTKKSQILGGGETLTSASKIAVQADQIFILLTGERRTIINPQLTVVIENDEEWGEIADLVAYAGNLYLLDKKGAIWKYPRTEAGFGSRRNYLAGDVTPDFSQASTMSIDGAIWVLNQGRVTKFVQGVPKSFSLQGLEEDLKEPVDIFTNEESENVYLLDKQGKMVVFDKEGRYQAQYSWEKLSQASDFVVSESLKKILVLLEGKIYGIEIK